MCMSNRYVLETRYKTIIPVITDGDDMRVWAREYPNMYNVYSAGYIIYYDRRALDWFILRWGMPEGSDSVSAVGLG